MRDIGLTEHEPVTPEAPDAPESLPEDERVEPGDARLRAILGHLRQNVTLIGPDGGFINAAAPVRDSMGYPDRFWEDHMAWEMVHPEDLPRLMEHHDELLRRPEHRVTVEFRVRRADGEYLHVEATATNLLADPTVGGILLSMRDVTDRKRAEADLAAARDQALTELRKRAEFMASVSHELRTPIHGILGLSELLATSEEVGPAASDLVTGMNRAARTLGVILNDVVDFSLVESGRFRMEPARIDVAALLDEVVGLFGSEARLRGLALHAEVAPRTPEKIVADPDRLRQVLGNLVVNALKFTPSGGVRLLAAPAGADTEDQAVRFSVSDTGIGIPPEAQQRIFEPFHQERRQPGGERQGTGLGLAIARRLVELMGGRIGLDSSPGEGSAFWVELPEGDEADVVAEGVAPPTPGLPTAGRGDVLIVEDDPVSRLLVSRQLEQLGRKAHVCTTAAAALDVMADRTVGPIAAVLADCHLPDSDGPTLCRELRSRADNRSGLRPLIVGLTGESSEELRGECRDAGMDGILTKPVSLSELGELFRTDDSSPQVSLAEPSWEPDRLEQLVEEVGDPTVSLRVVDCYLEQLPTRVDSIADATRDQDGSTVAAVAHVLASTSETVGAVQLGTWCRELQDRVLRHGPGDHTVRCLAFSLSAEARRVKAELNAWRERQVSLS